MRSLWYWVPFKVIVWCWVFRTSENWVMAMVGGTEVILDVRSAV